MKVIQFDGTGDPLEVLKMTERPLPEPRQGVIRVKVKACPINPSDKMFIRGQYRWRPDFPQLAGLEGAGIVDAVGSGVDMTPGTGVYFRTKGAWAEYIVGPSSVFSVAPTGISFEMLAQLSLNPPTAWALLHEARLHKGDWLLLTGGPSSVNRIIIQIAAARCIQTICTTRNLQAESVLKEFRATAVIDTSSDDLLESVMSLTNGQGVQCCFDAVGGPVAGQAYRTLAPKGRIFVYGVMSPEDFTLNNRTIIYKNLTIQGFGIDAWLVGASDEVENLMHREILEMVRSGRLKLPVEAAYPLDEFQKAIEHSRRTVVGKVLLVL